NADFLACCHQVIDGLFDGITYRTHSDDHMLCVCCSIVVEQFVICSDLLIDFVHVLLYDCRKRIVIRVTCLSCLEEDIRVLCRTSLARMIRVQCMFTELVHCIHINHIFQIFVIPCFDLLDLMRSTETVEEVNERNFSLDCCTVSNRSQVHNFLYAGLTQHCCTSLTTGVNIGVITEDGQCMACQCTCRYVEHTRKLLTCDLVQVRDHQQKNLGSCVGCCQGTCCQRTMYRTCSTCLGLHLSYLNFLSEDVLSSLSCPFVCGFRHNRRRGDWVNRCYVRIRIRSVSGSMITIHGFHRSEEHT